MSGCSRWRRSATPPRTPADSFFERYQKLFECTESDIKELRRIRHHEVPEYISGLVAGVPWEQFRVVGFTSTFQQNVASFALAREIKRHHPEVVTLFGGSNFEGAMGVELVRSTDCVDYAISGEADQSFPAFLMALAEGGQPEAVPGVVCRAGGRVRAAPPAPPFDRLDELPVPDYEEFFRRSEAVGLSETANRGDVVVPFESARGCWWGAKRHCTFCGLNGGTMTFRSKSPARVAAELAELVRRHHSFNFQAVDNIVDSSYLETLFPQLRRDGTDYRLFYEMKSNLSREQIKILRDGGVCRIQPGIESLNSQVLGLMRKGVRASHNVNLLRWARYYDLYTAWNLLWGFPGESAEDYRGQADLIRQVVHLQPPEAAGRIWMERFSPIFTDRERYPLDWLRPASSYALVYPAGVDLDQVAYFFDYRLHDTLPDDAYDETRKLVEDRQHAWEAPAKPSLTLRKSRDVIQIEDCRRAAQAGTHTFTDPSIYLACFEMPAKAAQVKSTPSLPHPVEEVEAALDEFVARDLMMRDGNLFLSLALPATPGR